MSDGDVISARRRTPRPGFRSVRCRPFGVVSRAPGRSNARDGTKAAKGDIAEPVTGVISPSLLTSLHAPIY